MKTYILKYPIYNSINFPIGTIVKPVKNRGYTSFEVVKGKLKGKRADIADNNVHAKWVVENTEKNRQLLMTLKLNKKIKKLEAMWENVSCPTIEF